MQNKEHFKRFKKSKFEKLKRQEKLLNLIDSRLELVNKQLF